MKSSTFELGLKVPKMLRQKSGVVYRTRTVLRILLGLQIIHSLKFGLHKELLRTCIMTINLLQQRCKNLKSVQSCATRCGNKLRYTYRLLCNNIALKIVPCNITLKYPRYRTKESLKQLAFLLHGRQVEISSGCFLES